MATVFEKPTFGLLITLNNLVGRVYLMNRVIKESFENIFGMSDLNPKRTGLPIKIWADHGGINRKVSHSNTPRVKIGTNDFWEVYTIEETPKLKKSSGNIKKSDKDKIKAGVDYVGRNYDLFLKHYMDIDDSFDDDDLKEELRSRGDYK